MPDNSVITESHGCLVCGRPYDMLVVRSPAGALVNCTVTTPGGHRVPDPRLPLVACNSHSAEEVHAAYVQHHPGAETPEDRERDDD